MTIRLADLDPQFLLVKDLKTFTHVESVEEADGIMFLCPVCFKANGGPKGTHRVVCWRPRVPQSIPPIPGRWEFQGAGYNDLTLVAGSSSIALTTGCKAHFFVKNGEIQP